MLVNFSQYYNVSPLVEYNHSLDVFSNFKDMFSGMVFNNGLIKVLKKDDIDYWRTQISIVFPRFIGKFEPFAFDWLGRFFCVHNNDSIFPEIFRFDIASNEVNTIDCSFTEFIDDHLLDYNDVILSSRFFNNWLTLNSPLDYNHTVGFINPAFLDGDMLLDNLSVFDIQYYWDNLFDALDDMPYNYSLLQHYRYFLGDDFTICDCDYDNIRLIDPDFTVLCFPPDDLPMWRYITLGMSSVDSPSPIELYIVTHEANDFIPQLLTWIAYYHKKASSFDLGNTINFGTPWFEGSNCDMGLISLPYIDGVDFKECGDVDCLWLIPITEDEASFKEEFGIDLLEKKFGYAKLNFLDYFRSSVL